MRNNILSLKATCFILTLILIVCSLSACATEGTDNSSDGWVVETIVVEEGSSKADTSASSSKKQDSVQKDKPASSNAGKTENADSDISDSESDSDAAIYGCCTQAMLEKSIMYKGDTTRLASKIKAALSNKNSTTKIAFLGDSITEGAVVGTGSAHYANLFASYWCNKIGNNLNVNIKGYGATTSYLGVHIAEDVILKDKPDIIFIEYVNDPKGMELTLNCMDSLLRKCLSLDNKPAVILLEMSYHGTTNAQTTHYKPAKVYGVPMISWQNALTLPLIEGDINWSDVAADEVHPNSTGHRMLYEMMRYFTESVVTTASTAKEPAAFNTPALTDDVYKDCKVLNRTNHTPSQVGSFVESVDFGPLNDGWATTSGGEITFKVTAKRIGFAYLCSHTLENGKAMLYVDGNLINTFNGKQSGYSCIRTMELKNYKTLSEHTITIKIADGDMNDFQILGLFTS